MDESIKNHQFRSWHLMDSADTITLKPMRYSIKSNQYKPWVATAGTDRGRRQAMALFPLPISKWRCPQGMPQSAQAAAGC
ncbi:hypothetical protein [Paracidovorax wautersii]|uniref:Uncharacterized protein n=1 Tax=Paracidovorax wautersii TaxID=1177982 RepID=A0ABU1IEC1_9BURK|nr:hypothetical protein [Paracidovorax wautersii]MDR6215547.1 hypothetical protein [Paracidovorax wautersii]